MNVTRPDFPKGTIVLVCDGAKALLLENAGDERALNLKPLAVTLEPHPRTRLMGADQPTRVFDSHDGSRSGAEQTDWHVEAEIAFLRESAQALETLARQPGQPGRPPIVIVAPPRALGVLRDNLGEATRKGLVVEIAKDLVKQPLEEIEAHLAALSALT